MNTLAAARSRVARRRNWENHMWALMSWEADARSRALSAAMTEHHAKQRALREGKS